MIDMSLENEKAKQILAERAEVLAKAKVESALKSETAILVFHVGKGQKYAIPYSSIEKVISAQKITSVPGVNPLCSGLLYHNAEIWPVVSLTLLLNCKDSEPANFILLREGSYHYAFTVDSIVGQVNYDESISLEHLAMEEQAQPQYVFGIYQTDIAMLDLSTIFKVLQSIQITR